MKDPKAHDELFAKREKQKTEGAMAMNDYIAAGEATRKKTAQLRELRLAKEAADRVAEVKQPSRSIKLRKAKEPTKGIV